MRARTVNEAQNFERGRNPKSSMGIGGINFAEEYTERVDDLKGYITSIKERYDLEWKDYIAEVLRGKTITAEMTKMPTMDKSGAMTGKHERREFTITVQDAVPGDELSRNIGEHITTMPSIIVADMDNNIYQMKLDQKVSFE